MRTLIYIVLGGVAGFALGVLVPIALFLFLSWQQPVQMQQGGGTPFAIMLIVTAPAGAIFGAYRGFRTAQPAGVIIKRGSRAAIERFEQQFGHRSIDEQRTELARVVPVWLKDYRRSMILRICMLIVVALLIRSTLLLILLLAIAASAARLIIDMRRAIRTVKARWGDEVVGSAWATSLFAARILRAVAGDRQEHRT